MRLRHASSEDGYLIVTADSSLLELAQWKLTAQFDAEVCDLDDLFFETLHAEAA